jgi:hypothetical protein
MILKTKGGLTLAAETRARSSVVFPENMGPHMMSILPLGGVDFSSLGVNFSSIGVNFSSLSFPSAVLMLLTTRRALSLITSRPQNPRLEKSLQEKN